MNLRPLLAAAVLLCGVGTASAQVLSVEFHDGQVNLIAENVPVSRILAEWARVGGTKIVNGERIPGAPVTLQLVDVPERQALDVVLRSAAGYMVAARETSSPGVSVFDRVLILPTTAPAPSAASLPPPTPQPPPQFVDDRNDVELEQFPEVEPQPEPALPIRRLGGPPLDPRGRVRSGLSFPNVQQEPPPPEDPEEGAQVAPGPVSPFGAIPGSARPGVVSPPPRNPGADPQPDR